MRAASEHQVELNGRRIDYRVVTSKTARKLRIRISPSGVEVTRPSGRNIGDVAAFINDNRQWVADQLDRVERFRGAIRQPPLFGGTILFRGDPTRLRIETSHARTRANQVRFVEGQIVIERGMNCRTPVYRSFETWLRKQARIQIENCLIKITTKLGHKPPRIYVMGQRTKWGNCSARRNLSFNWRLIFAPDFVLSYLVTHEAVHLVVPDHSAKFWLMVQSHCPDMERAKQWLSAHGQGLTIDLKTQLG